MELSQAVTELQGFCGKNLTRTLARIEASVQGVTAETSTDAVGSSGARADVLAAAGQIKRLASQINVVIHALSILLCLPRLLEPGEVVEYVSLGAGNTGRAFDLETNKRIAEFKFIRWQGGPEAIRQNALFKDFYFMAEHAGVKRKYLYVHDAHRQDPHLPMRYDTGRPRAVIRFKISQPRTTSLPCPAGLRARRPSPMMDLYRKNTFSTRL